MATILIPTFERIKKIRVSHADQTKLAACIASVGEKWGSSTFNWYKTWLIQKLRCLQNDKCCYCRRVILFNKGAREIEHIVDKGKQTRFMFEVSNLALACKDCNNNKGVKSVFASTFTLAPGAAYPMSASSYNWVHPYIHKYSSHIVIYQGWLYEPKNKSPQGAAVIKNCKLNDLEALESKNRIAAICAAQTLEAAVTRAAGMADEAGLDRICREVSPALAAMWSGKSSKKIEVAIRQAHGSVTSI
ncbi:MULTISPECIES: HNH endonuclease [unclassified Methylibium]|uniref:HNH endonuclease n=1 Tax=unclassified Methylibium TaxID=2633235 RepID=UPI0003F3EF7C|nr:MULTISPECIES: HNH endonuclease [unclassified Methylibium]EWS53413.1 hypothetical protein X551_03798 [Methylibium sp. T29]EWS58902.1 hypothetical protein Y694_03235 [Methylibium sp. T29-B]